MKTIMIMCSLCGLAIGAVAADPAANPFRGLTTQDVAKVELFDFVDPGIDVFAEHAPKTSPKGTWKSTGVVVTNSAVIAAMIHALSEVTLTNNLPYPGVGLLGHQFFFGKKGDILAVNTIVNYRATVLVGRSPDDSSPAGTRSYPYCRIVYNIMKTSLPDRLAELDALHSTKTGKGVELVLFDEEKK